MKKSSVFKWILVFVVIIPITWFGIMVWAKGPNIFKWEVQVSLRKDISNEEKAYQCLGIWRKLFEDDPMSKQWRSTWSKENIEFLHLCRLPKNQFSCHFQS